jgi:hypothetical protein
MAVLRIVAPKAVAHHDEHDGAWPVPEGELVARAPYLLDVVAGGTRLRVCDDAGGVVSAVGATVEDALAAIEEKVNG